MTVVVALSPFFFSSLFPSTSLSLSHQHFVIVSSLPHHCHCLLLLPVYIATSFSSPIFRSVEELVWVLDQKFKPCLEVQDYLSYGRFILSFTHIFPTKDSTVASICCLLYRKVSALVACFNKLQHYVVLSNLYVSDMSFSIVNKYHVKFNHASMSNKFN